jgi:hypothetical protein
MIKTTYKPSDLTVAVHKYGIIYTIIMLIFVLIYNEIYLNSFEFWCFFVLFCLNSYFSIVFGMAKGVRRVLLSAMNNINKKK